MKKILIFLIAILGTANAVDENYAKNRAGLKDDDAVFGTNEVISTKQEQNVDDVQDNTYAVIYNHLQQYEMKRKAGAVSQATNLNDDTIHDFYKDKLDEKQALLEAKKVEEQKAKEPYYVFLSGYCVLQNEIKIGRIAGYADLYCDLSESGKATLKVALTPDFYSKALIATPLHLDFDGKKYTVTAGAVQNGIRTSINVATEVDDYLVSRILADTGVQTSSVMTQYAQEYLDERRTYREYKNSKKNTTTQTTSGGNVIITEEDAGEDMPPRIDDYLGGALVEITGKLIESIGNAYLQTREYSFKIDAHTTLFADLQIDINEQGIKGVGFEPQNLIVQQPSTNFGDSDPTMGIDYPNANIGNLPKTGSNTSSVQTRQTEQSSARGRNNSSIFQDRNRQNPRMNDGRRNQYPQNYPNYGGNRAGGVVDMRRN